METSREPQIKVRISGTAMSTIEGSEINYDPVKYDGGSPGARAAHAALHGEIIHRRAGKGTSYLLAATVPGAATLYAYFTQQGETYLTESEADIRAEGRACLKVAEGIAKTLSGPGLGLCLHRRGYYHPDPCLAPAGHDGDHDWSYTKGTA